MKSHSIPCLEVCAAFLSPAPKVNIKSNLSIEPSNRNYTDPTINLGWLSREPSLWSTFVSNRVSEIQGQNSIAWNHVRIGDNPANPASQATESHAIQAPSLWWNGTDWLNTRSFLEPFYPGNFTP